MLAPGPVTARPAVGLMLAAALSCLGADCSRKAPPQEHCVPVDAAPPEPGYADDANDSTPLRPPAEVVHVAEAMNGLLIHGTDAFYRDIARAIVRLPLAGRVPEIAAPACGDERAIFAVHDATICCVERIERAEHEDGGDEIACTPLGGGPRRVLREHLPTVESLALDATDAYVGLRGAAGVSRIRRSDGQATLDGTNGDRHAGAQHIVLDGDTVYWNGPGGMFAASKNAAPGASTFKGPRSHGPIALGADAVYWGDGGGEDASAHDDVIWRRKKADGAFEALTTGEGAAQYLGVTDRHVYWWTRYFTLRRVHRLGGSPRTIGRRLTIHFMVGVGEDVYWMDGEPGRQTLYRLADATRVTQDD